MGLYVAIWVICALIALAVAASKGRSQVAWAAMGFVFGPLAVFVLLLLPKSEEKVTAAAIQGGELKRCPYCQEAIKAEAIKCKHCQSDLPSDDSLEVAGRSVHARLQQAIYGGDIEAARAILAQDPDLSDNPLPFSHLEYAELHGSDEMIDLVSRKA